MFFYINECWALRHSASRANHLMVICLFFPLEIVRDVGAFCFCLFGNFLVWVGFIFRNCSSFLHFKIFFSMFQWLLFCPGFSFLFLKGLVSFHFPLIPLSLPDFPVGVTLDFKNTRGRLCFLSLQKSFIRILLSPLEILHRIYYWHCVGWRHT